MLNNKKGFLLTPIRGSFLYGMLCLILTDYISFNNLFSLHKKICVGQVSVALSNTKTGVWHTHTQKVPHTGDNASLD